MVATQPQLSNALELMVLGHHLGNQVAVVVYDGHLGRMVVIQVLGNLCLQHEVSVVELFHLFNSFVINTLFRACKVTIFSSHSQDIFHQYSKKN